eukprot:3688565-Ditylum_brightwellii.AAC.1
MRMANGKAPGPSGVMLDALQALVWCEADPEKEGLNTHTEFLCDYIMEILQLFWIGELDMDSWHEGNLAPVPNKGNLSLTNNW